MGGMRRNAAFGCRRKLRRLKRAKAGRAINRTAAPMRPAATASG
jgi:hypothetical protein